MISSREKATLQLSRLRENQPLSHPGFKNPNIEISYSFIRSFERTISSFIQVSRKTSHFHLGRDKNHPSWFSWFRETQKVKHCRFRENPTFIYQAVEKKSTFFVVVSRKTTSSFITILKMKICDPSRSCIRTIPTLHYRGFEKDRLFVHQENRRVAPIYLCTEN